MAIRRGKIGKKNILGGRIHTVDFGAGLGEFIESSARLAFEKGKKQTHVGVEPFYDTIRMAEAMNTAQRERSVNIIYSKIVKKSAVEFLRDCVKRKRRIENGVHLRMPSPANSYEYPQMFGLLRKVMLPGSKVFLSTEQSGLAEQITKIAREHGFVSRKLKKVFAQKPGQERTVGKDYIIDSSLLKTNDEQKLAQTGRPIYFVEFTLPKRK
jgi:hypothetical protein